MKIQAVVTGVGGGIGSDLCQVLSDKGIKTYGISRSGQHRDFGPGYTHLQMDIGNHPNRKHILEQKIEKGLNNDLHLLIHNAGSLANRKFEEFVREDILSILEINFLVPAELTIDLMPWLRASRMAHIVYIGSMGGFQGSIRFPGLSIYSASKSAGSSLMESLAAEYEGQNLFFNTLALGKVETDMLQDAFPGQKGIESSVMAEFIADFSLNGYRFFNGKVLPVSAENPKLSF